MGSAVSLQRYVYTLSGETVKPDTDILQCDNHNSSRTECVMQAEDRDSDAHITEDAAMSWRKYCRALAKERNQATLLPSLLTES
mmetsp:Transcript_19958/g.28683  ORF Transcript_19958/g.28683 Transcript_19958/m.28683 type:complete len:84 (-) Transcript_19958:247-498(-)